MQDTFSIEYVDVPYDFHYSPDLLPEKDITGAYYFLKSPVDITIDIKKIRTIRTGVVIKNLNVVEQRKGTNVINVSKYFVQPFACPYQRLAEEGLVQLSPSVVFSGQPIELVFYNVGEKNVSIKRGDIVSCLTLFMSPHIQLTPVMPRFAEIPKHN